MLFVLDFVETRTDTLTVKDPRPPRGATTNGNLVLSPLRWDPGREISLVDESDTERIPTSPSVGVPVSA